MAHEPRRPFLALVPVLVLAAAPLAGAQPGGQEAPVRVFIASDDPGVRGETGVRHDFGSFYSAVVPAQAAASLRARGIAVEEVPAHMPLCHKPQHKCDGGGGPPDEPPARQVPSDPTPYGIEQIYHDAGIASTSGGAGRVLGHLDTGVDASHPDLVNRIAKCASTAGGNCNDKDGHGTHTAGTAAADGGSDGLGIWGVAPGASVHSYKVCTRWCFIDDTIAAIDACIADGCDVITFSIGGDGASSQERDAIQRFRAAGGLFVAAAGNDGPALGSIDYPAAFKEAVAVAAIGANKAVASFSSRGTAGGDPATQDGKVEFAAAGVAVESTWKGGGYKTISGTSMATPHVAGLALKKWAGDGASTRAALAVGVEDITQGQHAAAGYDPASGHGLPHA